MEREDERERGGRVGGVEARRESERGEVRGEREACGYTLSGGCDGVAAIAGAPHAASMEQPPVVRRGGGGRTLPERLAADCMRPSKVEQDSLRV